MNDNEKKTYDLLIDKSIEAYICSIEIYNKPTIKYRVEGFSFFICNAWELMLKAHLIKEEGFSSIYFKDSAERTISLSDAISKVFTNSKSPLNLNLKRIIELRNTSTHFIVPEYEMIYIPLFQSCIFNFNSRMLKFHNINMEKIIPLNFLQLSVTMASFSELEIKSKYPGILGEKIIKKEKVLEKEMNDYNSNYAIKFVNEFYITKKKDEADSIIRFDKSANESATIITKLQNPNLTHKLTYKAVVDLVNEKINKAGFSIKFTTQKFQLFIKYYNLKENEKFCFINSIYQNSTYSYSIQTVDFIWELIEKNPDTIYETLKEKLKN